ncbi:XRE family transcriptional regulator [Luteimicrobium subarcticum]|uniref:Putative transcriptional regulator n=1 Tax=Luteimicrobium subarcticum TaxID=620910 RepID=A0A2M8WUY6_9MICO|nr:XRE family transcriptional regulator [Luteimicrobium subarcticum]PJI94686.1 putative transcriptional regulator [Luteimicrobium subarcticum]
MATSTGQTVPAGGTFDEEPDALTIGRRVRHLRTRQGMTLEELAAAIDRAPSQVSMIENGRREPKFSQLQQIAKALGASLDDLFSTEAPSPRAALEIELERAQRGPLFDALGIKAVRVGKALPTDALEALVGLQRAIVELHGERRSTPEQARRANTELRAQMRAQDNYFPDLEQAARELLDAVGHTGGPISQRVASDIAAHLGFSLHYVSDLPQTTRSVIDRRHHRLYLPGGSRATGFSRTAVLQALASHVLGHTEPADYAEFLRQRVESNYLSAAVLMPEDAAGELLAGQKARREISIEDLRDAFAVSYEAAAHRFTNLATSRLGLRVHFMKVHESGVIHKAYENDGVRFPADPLGAVEGQPVCRHWTARTIFDVEDRLSPFSQYTDTPAGTFWCTTRTQRTADGEFSVSVGVPFAEVRWFLGRDTPHRDVSRCPDESCCRRPAGVLADRWEGQVWPAPAPHASMLAALPVGSFPGVDTTEVYMFLERHRPHGAA